MNVAFYREEPSERRVHRLTRPEAAVLAGLERDVWLRPNAEREHGGTASPEFGACVPLPPERATPAGELTAGPASWAAPPYQGRRGVLPG